jgi:predicted transcriptional regulator
VITTQHPGFGHGLRDGDTHDINCTSCKQDLVYLRSYPEARKVFETIEYLNRQNRTTNNSQIASASGVSRNRVAQVTRMLRQRRWIKDTSKGAAYHWRTTGKPMPPAPSSEGDAR